MSLQRFLSVFFLLTALSLRETQVQGDSVDLTTVFEAYDTSVVEATVQQLNQLTEKNDKLQADNRLIRRIAWVETADGTEADTYAGTTYHGGIWGVDKVVFDETKSMYNDVTYDSIFSDMEQLFCINWGVVTWNDCRKPLYSALAARLYFHKIDPSPIPSGVADQAQKWRNGYNSRQGDTEQSFIDKVSVIEKRGCDTQGIDLIFVLDGSGSVTSGGFSTTKTFVLGVVDFFEIGADQVRVGVIQYSSSPRTEFHLNDYTDKTSLKQAISRISYQDGGTKTGSAINTMVTNFSPENGARPTSRGLPRVGVVVTDGKSYDSVVGPADNAREKGIIIFAIGVTSSVVKAQLNDIANKPNDTYVFHVQDYDAISSIGAVLQSTACDRSEPIVNETVNNTINEGQKQNFQVPVTSLGLSIIFSASSGRSVLFISVSTPTPNDAHYDFKLVVVTGKTVEIYLSVELFNEKTCGGGNANTGRKRRQAENEEDLIGTAYMTIEGKQITNNFALMVAEGDITSPTPSSGCESITSTATLVTAVLVVFIARLVSVRLYN